MSQLRDLWDRAEAAVARALLVLVARAPLPVTLALADLTARGVFHLWPRRRRIAVGNIQLAGIGAGETEARALARASFRAFTSMVVESIVARRRLTRENWTEHVRLRVSPEAEALLRTPGQGLIVASAHLGNWEVAARAVSMLRPMCVAYRPFNNPHLDRVAHAARQGENLRLVSRLDESPLRFVRALAAGEVVALMIDQHATRGRVAVRFFDQPAWTTKSVAMLHLATRTPLLVAFAIRTGPLCYEVHAAGPLEYARSGDREKDAADITQALTWEIEQVVRRFPEQYMWGHRRWR